MSKDKSETQAILNHRASYNNIEALMQSLQTAMEKGDKHPWKDKIKNHLSFNNDNLSPLKAQQMRFDKENQLPGDPDLTPEATNPFCFTLT